MKLNVAEILSGFHFGLNGEKRMFLIFVVFMYGEITMLEILTCFRAIIRFYMHMVVALIMASIIKLNIKR